MSDGSVCLLDRSKKCSRAIIQRRGNTIPIIFNARAQRHYVRHQDHRPQTCPLVLCFPKDALQKYFDVFFSRARWLTKKNNSTKTWTAAEVPGFFCAAPGSRSGAPGWRREGLTSQLKWLKSRALETCAFQELIPDWRLGPPKRYRLPTWKNPKANLMTPKQAGFHNVVGIGGRMLRSTCGWGVDGLTAARPCRGLCAGECRPAIATGKPCLQHFKRSRSRRRRLGAWRCFGPSLRTRVPTTTRIVVLWGGQWRRSTLLKVTGGSRLAIAWTLVTRTRLKSLQSEVRVHQGLGADPDVYSFVANDFSAW